MQEENKIEADVKVVKDPKANLEMRYVDEYLQTNGYSIKELDTLPEFEATRLMIDAYQYASLKLAESESRARLRANIKNTSDST